MDIVEKMKKWDTWDAMVEDLRPYLDEVRVRVKKKDDSIIQDFYILELIFNSKVIVEFSKAINELLESADAYVKAYCDVVADIMKLHRNSDKLDDVLEAQTQLLGYEKDRIRQDWKKQHAIETKGDENLVEDSKMGEYLKAKCDELGNIKAKIVENDFRQQEKRDFMWMVYNTQHWVECQRIFRWALPDLHNEHQERIQNMSAEDNSCSSTQAKRWHASSEDNIAASSEDNICGPSKKSKIDFNPYSFEG